MLLTYRLALLLSAAGTLALSAPAPAGTPVSPGPASTTVTGNYVLLSWNDLGMHCMNQYHPNLSVLPPYNNLRRAGASGAATR